MNCSRQANVLDYFLILAIVLCISCHQDLSFVSSCDYLMQAGAVLGAYFDCSHCQYMDELILKCFVKGRKTIGASQEVSRVQLYHYFEYLKKNLNLKKAAMLTLLESFIYQYVRFILYLCCLTALTKREDAQEPETVL